MRRFRTKGDEDRRDIYYWHRALRDSGRAFPPRDELLMHGRSMDHIVYHMTRDNIASLTDEEARHVLAFDPGAGEIVVCGRSVRRTNLRLEGSILVSNDSARMMMDSIHVDCQVEPHFGAAGRKDQSA